jgi:hypothetical protein
MVHLLGEFLASIVRRYEFDVKMRLTGRLRDISLVKGCALTAELSARAWNDRDFTGPPVNRAPRLCLRLCPSAVGQPPGDRRARWRVGGQMRPL